MELQRNVKDSVFTYIFKNVEYTLRLYREFHPEDSEVREEDIDIITIENILVKAPYNDLGFLVRNKLIVLCEAQSTFTKNMAIRILLYLASTYNRYIINHGLSIYSEKPLVLPTPELYVIFTGEDEPKEDGKGIPETVRSFPETGRC